MLGFNYFHPTSVSSYLFLLICSIMYISQKHISVNWLAHIICKPVIVEYAVGNPSATSL